MDLTSKQRKLLRSKAHHLKPYIIIGKNGLTESSINSISRLLNQHELIKVKIVDKENRENIKDKILLKTSSSIVGSIGKIVIIYKESDNKDDAEKIKIND